MPNTTPIETAKIWGNFPRYCESAVSDPHPNIFIENKQIKQVYEC